MGISEHIARSNRLSNAGGRYPNALAHATTLAIMLIKLARVDAKARPAMTAVALFMWLTLGWKYISSASDIPDFIKISATKPCKKHTFRTFYDRTVSWAEYARPCKYKNRIVYLWQPMPTYLNVFFQRFISDHTYGTPFLNLKNKAHLFEIIKAAWKTPNTLKDNPRVNKNTFQHYFINCAQADNTLGAIVRSQLITNNRAHHSSAIYYQQLNTDRIRGKIFNAHNRYLSRLINAAKKAELHVYFELFLEEYSVNLINTSITEADYLSQPGEISQFELDITQNSRDKKRTPAILIGSARSLEDNHVSHFFQKVHTLVVNAKERVLAKGPRSKTYLANQSALRDYYNKATYRIALLFIVLTGARPTHSISILSIYYSGSDVVFIKDKGVLRQLILCDYLQQEIKQYLSLQSVIRTQLSIHTELDELWYTCSEKNIPKALTSRELRLFMHQIWPNVVPYQLRHFFSFCANSHMFSDKLYDNDIDRLMGHENLGERLGSDMLFSPRFEAIKGFLNTLPKRLGLKDLTYV